MKVIELARMQLGAKQVNILLENMICKRNICSYIVLPDEVEKAIATDVKTTQHFNDVELDVQKADIFTKSDAQKVVALSQVATYLRSPYQVFNITDGLLLHRHMNT
jgi:hypothetical protein